MISVCTNCPANIQQMEQCVEICDLNMYPHQYPDGGVGCRNCPSKIGLALNPNRNGCVRMNQFNINANGVFTLTNTTTTIQTNSTSIT